METSKRRVSDPLMVQYIWDAVDLANAQKQVPTFDRLFFYLKREHNMAKAEAERHFQLALHDDLLRKFCRVSHKGTNQGIEQESFRYPRQDQSQEMIMDDHDWYCFECHGSGDVAACSTCYRVYHPSCVQNESLLAGKFICPICKLFKLPVTLKIKKDDLNKLLVYTCSRLKEKPIEYARLKNEDETWRRSLLVFREIDVDDMEDNALNKLYRRLEEFEADALQILHNTVIYFGADSVQAHVAKQMLKDCIYDLGEIKQCPECYAMSNEKADRHWFCQPCDPPHEVVFAKQKGFPYWPAKVLRKDGGVYDVRFFGTHHERAKIPKQHIKPITTKVQTLVTKRSVSWNKSWEELQLHQHLVKMITGKNLVGAVHEGNEDSDVESPAAKKPNLRSFLKPTLKMRDSNMAKTGMMKRMESRHLKLPETKRGKLTELGAAKHDEKNSKIPDFKAAKSQNSKPVKSSELKAVSKPPESGASRPLDPIQAMEVEIPKLPDQKPAKQVEPKIPKTEPKIARPTEVKSAGPLESRRIIDRRVAEIRLADICGNMSESSNCVQNDSSISSSVKGGRLRKLTPTPEDLNVVSSSSQETSSTNCCIQISVGTQTLKPIVRTVSKSLQVDIQDFKIAEEHAKALKLLEEKLLAEFRVLKEKALSDLSQKLERQHAKDLERSVAGALDSMKKEYDKTVKDVKERHRDTVEKVIKEMRERSVQMQERSLKEYKEKNKDACEKAVKEFEAKSRESHEKAIKEIREEHSKVLENAVKEAEEKSQLVHSEEIKLLNERHKQAISEAKKKQWCYNCEAEAIYHCCWNTSYCSIDCQQIHWQKEHKRNCRRKR